MAEETVRYNVEINTDDLPAQLQNLRSQIDGAMAGAFSTGGAAPMSVSTVQGIAPQYEGPGIPGNQFYETMQTQFTDTQRGLQAGFDSFMKDSKGVLDTIMDLPTTIRGLLPGGSVPEYHPMMPVSPREYEAYRDEAIRSDIRNTVGEATTFGASVALPAIGFALGGPIGAGAGLVAGLTVGEMWEEYKGQEDFKKLIRPVISSMTQQGVIGSFAFAESAAQEVTDVILSNVGASELYSLEQVTKNLGVLMQNNAFSRNIYGTHAAASAAIVDTLIKVPAIANSLGVSQEEAAAAMGQLRSLGITTPDSESEKTYFTDMSALASTLGVDPSLLLGAAVTGATAAIGTGISMRAASGQMVASTITAARFGSSPGIGSTDPTSPNYDPSQVDLRDRFGSTSNMATALYKKQAELADSPIGLAAALARKKYGADFDMSTLNGSMMTELLAEAGSSPEALLEARYYQYTDAGKEDLVTANMALQSSQLRDYYGIEANEMNLVGYGVAAAGTIAAGPLAQLQARSAGRGVNVTTALNTPPAGKASSEQQGKFNAAKKRIEQDWEERTEKARRGWFSQLTTSWLQQGARTLGNIVEEGTDLAYNWYRSWDAWFGGEDWRPSIGSNDRRDALDPFAAKYLAQALTREEVVDNKFARPDEFDRNLDSFYGKALDKYFTKENFPALRDLSDEQFQEKKDYVASRLRIIRSSDSLDAGAGELPMGVKEIMETVGEDAAKVVELAEQGGDLRRYSEGSWRRRVIKSLLEKGFNFNTPEAREEFQRAYENVVGAGVYGAKGVTMPGPKPKSTSQNETSHSDLSPTSESRALDKIAKSTAGLEKLVPALDRLNRFLDRYGIS